MLNRHPLSATHILFSFECDANLCVELEFVLVKIFCTKEIVMDVVFCFPPPKNCLLLLLLCPEEVGNGGGISDMGCLDDASSLLLQFGETPEFLITTTTTFFVTTTETNDQPTTTITMFQRTITTTIQLSRGLDLSFAVSKSAVGNVQRFDSPI